MPFWLKRALASGSFVGGKFLSPPLPLVGAIAFIWLLCYFLIWFAGLGLYGIAEIAVVALPGTWTGFLLWILQGAFICGELHFILTPDYILFLQQHSWITYLVLQTWLFVREWAWGINS